jgi:hypothetical protein
MNNRALITGIALLLATGAAHAGGYSKTDEWTLNCRMEAINKGRPDNSDWDEHTMVITRADLPALEKEIKKFKQCIAFWKCTEDRAAGKVKHCYDNDKRWRDLK